MDHIYSFEDLAIARRCLRQFSLRLERRSELQSSGAELTLADFLEYPSGSAATHQFLERYRIEQAYINALNTGGSPVIHPGALACAFGETSCGLDSLLQRGSESLEEFRRGEISVIMNAVVLAGRRLIRIDRLSRDGSGQIRLDLARTSSKIKDGYVRDAGWTVQGLDALGIKVDDIEILLLDREGAGDEGSFFKAIRQKRRHKFIRQDVGEELQRYIDALKDGPPGPCRSEYCPVCSSERPRANDWGSIHNLHKSGGLSRQLSEQGILWVDELDQVKSPLREKLKAHHWIQHRCEKTGEEHVDAPALRKFLDGLKWPLYFIDFECFLEALPSWTGVGAWEHAPFLYSLYRMDRTLTVTRMDHVLIPPGQDLRREMAGQLVRDIGTAGSVLVYGIHFERSILQRLAAAVPEHADALISVVNRLVDLQTPFADFSYYHPHQSGKISLKVLLPIMTEHGYADERVSKRQRGVCRLLLPAASRIAGEGRMGSLCR
jgi:hypothetical protein